MSRVAQHHRSGAALIIAIVVLAALLMLGLPFLFTQSGSLSGTRSYAHSELANIGQDSAQSMGVKAGAEAVGYHWQQDGMRLLRAPASTPLIVNDWTSLFYDLGGNDDPQSGVHIRSANLLSFDTRNHAFALPGGNFLSGMDSDDRDIQLRRYPIVVGLTIEDESGKLNPNYLDAVAWGRLLEAVGINDWPSATPVTTPAFKDPGRNQLARALAALRYRLAGGRITSLDQLLRAEPSSQPSTRRGLTRSELELLRPYLSLSVPSQARGGMIDLGTVIGSSDSDKKISIDSTQPVGLIAFPITPLVIGVGTTVLAEDNTGVIHALPVTGDDEAVVPKIGNPLAIDAPPLVNVHQAEPAVQKVFSIQNVNLPHVRQPIAARPMASPPEPAQTFAPVLISELDTYDLNGVKPVDALLRTRSWFELTSPLSIPETLGSADVVDAHNNETPRLRMISRDAENKETVPNNAFYLDVSGDSLDHFPNSGQAKLFGTLAIDALPPAGTEITYIQDFEFISYEAKPIGALPQSVGSARANSRVTVYIERGKLSSDAKTFRLNGLKFIAIAPREQHPIGIASQGVITIASAATVTDPAGNQTAQQQHRVIAQALPQETPLEARWNKQAAFHALLAQRHGSLMTTFPQPYPRITDLMPQDAPNVSAPTDVPPNKPYVPPVIMTDLDSSVGVRPAVMRTLLSNPHVDRTWTLPFSGDKNNFLNAFRFSRLSVAQTPINYSNADVNRMTPEGLRLDASRVLSYPNPNNGLISSSETALAQISGRQFGLWVRPDASWTGQVALLDMRIHLDNVGERLSGNAMSELSQDERIKEDVDAIISNRFSLVYDAEFKQLVLTLNPGSIPHIVDYGPSIPQQTYGPISGSGIPLKSTVWPAVNPECLGAGGRHPMASVAAIPSTIPIQHRYALGSSGFQSGEWHLIQVAFSSNQPGGMSIIVDGLVGRDVTSQPSDLTAMTLPGDHLTQPALVLATDLSTTEQVSDVGTKALMVDRIALTAVVYAENKKFTAAAAVQRLLPKRGMVRIGSEYISYQWIDTDGALRDCVRARRQRTTGGVDAAGVPNWGTSHVMERHLVGDLVYPGGFAFAMDRSATWWRGGCHLAEPMPDGDPAHRYQVWANVNVTTILDVTSTAIPLAGRLAIIDQFPPRGYVTLNGLEAYYDNEGVRPALVPGGPSLLNVHYWGSINETAPDEWIPHLPLSLNPSAEVVLISQEIAGADPKAEADPRSSYPPSGLIQLYDARSSDTATPNAGRAEWISYSEIRSKKDFFPKAAVGEWVSYLINKSSEVFEVPGPIPPGKVLVNVERGGFWFSDVLIPRKLRRQGARGRERTAFAAADIDGYVAAKYNFPALSTRVIPVQTNVDIAYLLEAGDVVTLASQVMSGRQRLLQMCVRYSADDSFPYTKGSTTATAWDSENKNFAFTEALPNDWNSSNSPCQLLCWPCWTPEVDISPFQTSDWKQRLGWVLPWGKAYNDTFTLGAPDMRTISLFSTGVNSANGVAATIDAVHAGAQPGCQEGRAIQAHIVQPNNNVWLDDQPLTAHMLIRTDQPIFFSSYGIIEIGGETFAYKTDWQQDEVDFGNPNAVPPIPQTDPVRTNQAWLIGRSLLGSTRRAHQGPELVLHLPIGPVAEVIGTIPATEDLTEPLSRVARSKGQMGRNFVGPLNLASDPNIPFNPPAVLLTSRNGDQQEMTVLPNNHTAPWLRGMYNTTPINWVDRGSAAEIPDLAPLAIGWWPRYPSGYPKDLSTRSPVERSAFLRCRSYAWAGFPLRFHDSQFSGADLAQVTALSTGGGLFDLQALALDGRMDWGVAKMVPSLNGNPSATPVNISPVFNSEIFKVPTDEALNSRLTNEAGAIRTVDGAELRIIWTYHDKPLIEEDPDASPAKWLQDTALTGNSAPMIGPVYLRARAPNKIISVER